MRVWVTRARPGAEATAARLEAMGHAALVDPLLLVRPLPASIDLEDVPALAFTSANGVRAFEDRRPVRGPERALPVFAVGEATAAAAREAGFADVSAAGGDVHSLVRLIAGRRPGGILHLGPSEPAGDLVGDLARHGVPARAVALYETVPLHPAAALEALAAGGLDAVLLHSPKAARTLAALPVPPARRIRALGISAAAIAPLAEAGWGALSAAGAPDEASLLALLAD